eukprot:553233-Prorocentrum_lima.AAC.1
MTSSLVGSEMCIRDRSSAGMAATRARPQGPPRRVRLPRAKPLIPTQSHSTPHRATKQNPRHRGSTPMATAPAACPGH